MSETVSNRSSGWARHRMLWLLLLMSVVIGCLIWAWWFLSQPVFGTIQVMPEATAPANEKIIEKKLYQGKKMTFSYQGSYDQKSSRVSIDGPILESILLANSTLDGRKIAVTVANRGTSDLMSDPSYQVRLNDRKTYRQSSFSVGSYEGEMFETTEAPFEKTAFFSTHGLIVSMALTSLFQLEGLGVELEALLADFSVTSE